MFQSVFFIWFSLLPLPKNSETTVDGLFTHELMEQVSLCNTFPFSYQRKAEAFIPLGYRQIFETNNTPLLNVVRVFKKKNTLVLLFRGTVNETNSWLENVHFMQIRAKDTLIVEGREYPYFFSQDKKAQVHSGYVLGIHYLWLELREFLMAELNNGVERIICTGHSQGGALAQLFMAQLDLKSDFQNVDLMNYSFGSPKIGNQAFADDFNARFTQKNGSFRFVNQDDLVCYLPLANQRYEFSYRGYETQLDLETATFWLQLGKELLPEKYKSKVDRTVEIAIGTAEKIMKEKVGDIDFPEFSTNVFYASTGKTIELDAQPYPAWMQVPSSDQSAAWIRYLSETKNSINRELTFFQHHIFTYYNALDAHYQPKGFRRVRMRTLSEEFL